MSLNFEGVEIMTLPCIGLRCAVRSEICCALRLRYIDFVVGNEVAVDITSNTIYKCAATFQTHCISLLLITFDT
jgi:hypothetical protein